MSLSSSKRSRSASLAGRAPIGFITRCMPGSIQGMLRIAD